MSINITNLTFNRLTQEEEEKVLWESKPFGASPTNEDVDQDNTKFTLNLRFLGQYFDKETQTHYNINRDYNPVTGRYIQSDPIGFDGGVNGFGYVGGMPIRFVDLEGLSAEDVIIITNTLHKLVAYLVNNNLRRAGSGSYNGWINNLESWSKGYYGCIDQAIWILPKLKRLKLKDIWIFEEYRYSLVHSNVKVISSNSSDPGLYVDPWKDEIEEF